VNDIVAEARTYLGVPWKHQGRSKNGVDCAGLVIEVAKACRGSDFDVRNYPRQAYDETMLLLCRRHMVKVKEPQPGDALVFGLANSRHIGIAGDYHLGGLSLIHAWLAVGKVVETRLDEQWLSRLRGAYRFPETM
jgi:cell wall-associated NlpC family hydrolase